jgi:lipid-binding SYLF domain-containing protein
MKKTIAIGMLAALGAFAGVLVNGSRLQAADEIRCRVNAEALMRDLAALGLANPLDADAIKNLLKRPNP